MKKLFILFLAIVSFASVRAQITRESYPPTGHKYLYRQDKNPSMQWSYFDDNLIWDFSGLNGSDSIKVKTLLPEDTYWPNNFPQSNYVMTYFTPTDSTYYYYTLTDTALWQRGLAVYVSDQKVYILFRYDSPQVLLPFPFNVGDTSVSRKTASTSLLFQTVNLEHNDSLIALASGTLTLPGGRTYNVMLLKHYVFIHIWAANILDETYEKIIYEWVGDGSDRGMMIASADSNLITGSFESVQYYEYSAATPVENIFSSLKIYPNPAGDYLFVDGMQYPFIVKVYNLEGKKLIEAKNKNVLNIAGLTPGIYILKVRTKDYNLDFKFVKK